TILHKDIHHRVELIEDGLWQIGFNFPTSTNCWLYQESDGLVLVDTGNSWNHGTILDTVERTGQPLRKIIITHAHPDHAGSAAALSEATGATVYAHKEDVKYINGTKSMASLPGSIESRLLHSTADRIGILNPSPVKNVL